MIADLWLGARLAWADRRSVSRSIFTALGVGMALAILLLAASVPPAWSSRAERSHGLVGVKDPGAAADGAATATVLYDEFGDRDIQGYTIFDSADATILPPGLDHFPGPGELIVSPAMQRLLDEDSSGLLRHRYPGPVVAIIADDGLADPADLRVYRGALSDEAPANAMSITTWGDGEARNSSPTGDGAVLWYALVGVAAIVVLLPPMTMIAISSRMSSARRDRRLAAIRLVGASRAQTNRIGAGEGLPGAALGVAIGIGLFFVGREFAEKLAFAGRSVFASDLFPTWFGFAICVALVPLLTLGATLFGLRGSVVEPLGVARQANRRPRRAWWRLTLLGAGTLSLIVLVFGALSADDGQYQLSLLAGCAAVIISVPLLVPIVVPALAKLLPTGWSPALLLATRRLQADPESTARLSGGLAVTLAAVILGANVAQYATTTVGAPTDGATLKNPWQMESLQIYGQPGGPSGPEFADAIDSLDGVLHVLATAKGAVVLAGLEDTEPYPVAFTTCATFDWRWLHDCEPGQVFRFDPPASGAGPQDVPDALFGASLRFVDQYGNVDPGAATFTLPPPTSVEDSGYIAETFGTPLVMTFESLPTVLDDPDLLWAYQWSVVTAQPGTPPQTAELIKNAYFDLAGFPPRSNNWYADAGSESAFLDTVASVRQILIGFTVAIVLLAVGGLTLAATDHVAERRALLGYLAATGTPRELLNKSVLLGGFLPAAVAIILATAAGVGTSWAILTWLSDNGINPNFSLDWTLTAGLSVGSLALIALALTATLPAVRAATRPETLRFE